MDIIKSHVKYGNFTLKSGLESKFYIDLRPIISSPVEIKEICKHLASLIPSSTSDEVEDDIKICGLPYAGIPYTCALSILYDIPMLLLRNEEKKWGTKKMIEGVYKKGDELIIVDDVLTTGSSVVESLPHFKDFKILKVIVILDREQGGRERLEKMGLLVESLFKKSDLGLES